MGKVKVPNIHLVVLIISSTIGYCISSSRSWVYDPSWPHKSATNLRLHATAVVQDFEDNIIVLNRGSRHAYPERNNTIAEEVIIVLDRENGTQLRQWGKDFFHHPHGMAAASNGDIFITDSHLHQVFKFAYIPETKLWNDTPIMTLGERLVNGSDRYHFDIPADVAIEPDTENFYVADGYGNKRVVKFDRCGNYILEFMSGAMGDSIPIPFNIVHKVTVAIRHNPTANRAVRRSVNNQDVIVAVADRDNNRIQYFSGNGSFLYEQTHENLGIPPQWVMSVDHLDVNPRNAPYSVDDPADFGLVYAVDTGSNTVAPRVLEIAVDWSNATVISDFLTNNTNPYVRRGSSHDLAVSRDGKEVYVVISNTNIHIVKRFRMEVQSGANGNHLLSFLTVFVMAFSSTIV